MKRSSIMFCVAMAMIVMATLAPPAQALVADGAQGWFWQMPQPAGGIPGLSALAFPDAGHLWAVGAGGLILHSGDAGATWVPQSQPTTADLWSVSFPDDQHGWACGGSASGTAGVILGTSDGGATWLDKTPSSLTDSLVDASFVDASHGWIGTDDGDILKTSNGGATWTHQKLASSYRGEMAGYRTVDFVDAEHGWAGGMAGRLWATRNGGKSWTSLPDGLSRDMLVTQIDFADRSHGWVLAQSWDTGESQVLSTSDGGMLWRTVSTNDPSVGSLDVVSASDVWLLDDADADPYVSEFGGVGAVTLRHTTDGGTRWRSSSVASPVAVNAIAASGTTVCAVGEGILTSSDAAATWRPATSGQQFLFTGATALSASDIWAVDASGALLHSGDGLHWVEQPDPARWGSVLFDLSFPDPNDGWLVGASDEYGDGSVILHSSDGGTSWSPQSSTLSGELVGVDFVDDSNGWAISDDNESDGGIGAPLTIEHTSDGGTTWLPEYVYDNAELFAVDFINTTTGWVAGDYVPSENSDGLPGIFASTNGGVTWTREKLPSGAPDMTGLQFLDGSDGWAVGTSYDQDDEYPQQGWVLHTTDGGKSWARLAGLDDSLATTVHFSDAQHGWLGGLNGVYATTDGGASWQHVAGGDGVTAIAGLDAHHAWAFGAGFLVSTVDGSGDTAAPMTLVDDYDAWYDRPATISLSPSDVGASGVGSTAYSTDGGASWRTGTSVAVDAPADHANDGQHTILYRSLDNAGNQEQTESLVVGIDTLGPACTATRASVVDTGKSGILYFKAADATSGVAQATISIVDSRGRVVRKIVERATDWGAPLQLPYYWLSFDCTLKPGTYRVEVRATDQAGNRQIEVGRNSLRVVRGGAPKVHHPAWPAGLPSSSTGFSGRLDHSPRAQRLWTSLGLLPGVSRPHDPRLEGSVR